MDRSTQLWTEQSVVDFDAVCHLAQGPVKDRVDCVRLKKLLFADPSKTQAIRVSELKIIRIEAAQDVPFR